MLYDSMISPNWWFNQQSSILWALNWIISNQDCVGNYSVLSFPGNLSKSLLGLEHWLMVPKAILSRDDQKKSEVMPQQSCLFYRNNNVKSNSNILKLMYYMRMYQKESCQGQGQSQQVHELPLQGLTYKSVRYLAAFKDHKDEWYQKVYFTRIFKSYENKTIIQFGCPPQQLQPQYGIRRLFRSFAPPRNFLCFFGPLFPCIPLQTSHCALGDFTDLPLQLSFKVVTFWITIRGAW